MSHHPEPDPTTPEQRAARLLGQAYTERTGREPSPELLAALENMAATIVTALIEVSR